MGHASKCEKKKENRYGRKQIKRRSPHREVKRKRKSRNRRQRKEKLLT